MFYVMKKILQKLGYRPLNEKIWAKPFGNSLIAFKVEELKIAQYFQGANNKTLIWDSETLSEDDLHNGICQFENWNVKRGLCTPNKDFGFLTQEEEFAEIL